MHGLPILLIHKINVKLSFKTKADCDTFKLFMIIIFYILFKNINELQKYLIWNKSSFSCTVWTSESERLSHWTSFWYFVCIITLIWLFNSTCYCFGWRNITVYISVAWVSETSWTVYASWTWTLIQLIIAGWVGV